MGKREPSVTREGREASRSPSPLPESIPQKPTHSNTRGEEDHWNHKESKDTTTPLSSSRSTRQSEVNH